MARLDDSLLRRIESFAHRVCDVAELVASQRRSGRVVDQMFGAMTSVAANAFEADEAMSRSDIVKCLSISVKELNETRFWLRFVAKRDWITASRLEPLETECVELKRVLGAMIARTKRGATRSPSMRVRTSPGV